MSTSEMRVKFCPGCGYAWTMELCIHLAQPYECAEHERFRFQRCNHCGWSGDVVSKKQYVFRFYKGILLVDGVHHRGGFYGFLKAIGLC